MKDRIDGLIARCRGEIATCTCVQSLTECKVKFLGKNGELTAILRGMKDLSPEDKPIIGSLVNKARDELANELTIAEQSLKQAELNSKLNNEKVDITWVKNTDKSGTLHPLTKIQNLIIDSFVPMGFEVLEGPEIETEYYNFEALNVPADHPARDMQDTFYITQNILLRTHTSPNQVRTMEAKKPPIKMLCPGRTYRADYDASHSPVFHQIEGLVIDENLTLCDLMGTLECVARKLFSADTKVRFRPSYFPFTEPSVEVDVSCCKCGGVGCSVCKGTGWVEILGAGMVHPYVLENCGIDSNKYTGFAFGLGVERMAMIKYGITDIRLFFENDKRFLKQFNK
ncbi:MAG: phenylalanine--tRNA ligase subunit alpha [Clostridia bacterium]|nr:phenylalanine--tRNA ligase subunit alpha [Clostridia bacterium]